ncbi:MAG TPA: OsmC family peroxiredoxin [Gemmatimonadales bacterium]|nr:OsmC family peroxiredoxin [Gemmatimonadales bacterium]
MKRHADARWTGDLKTGQGSLAVGSGAFKGAYSFASRFEDGGGTNPEELLGAAHAGCYSMALALATATAGYVATSVETKATVHLGLSDGHHKITRIDLECTGVVPGISEAEFLKLAEATKSGCIVSQALSAVPMHLNARLVPG